MTAGVPFDKAGPMETLTREGDHRFEMSPTGSYVIDTASSHRKPAQVTLKTLTGDVIRRIALDNQPMPFKTSARGTACPAKSQQDLPGREWRKHLRG